jgi:hypothetical protein
MSVGVMTEEQRQTAAETKLANGRKRLDACAATVGALLADAGGKVPSYAQAHAVKARKGSTRSLIALKCLDCCCWEKAEVAACPVVSCPLYPVRPYKGAA